MQSQILKILAILAFPVAVFISCGDEAQEAAEEANRDTVPVIETNPDKDSINTDSVIPH